MVIEWNAHMFARDMTRYPTHARATYVPDASMLRADPLTDYLDRMQQEGIDGAVLVQPEPYGDDHRLLLDCLARAPERLRGAALFYPTDPDAANKLEALVQREPRIMAVRFHAHRGKTTYLNHFTDPGVRRLWDRAAKMGLIVELHIGPDYAAQVAEVIHAYPDTPVLIDHLAEPHMGTAVEYAHVLTLARLDNVIMKLSGLEHITAASEGQDLRPLLRLVVDTFGPDHLAWGGGAPGAIADIVAHWPPSDRDKVLGGTLARLLHLPSPDSVKGGCPL